MKLKGTVGEVSSTGEGVEVTVVNVREVGAADWREYCSTKFRTTELRGKVFYVGREVIMTVKAK